MFVLPVIWLSVAVFPLRYHVYVGLVPPFVTDATKSGLGLPTHNGLGSLIDTETVAGCVTEDIVFDAVAVLGDAHEMLEVIVTDTTSFWTS